MNNFPKVLALVTLAWVSGLGPALRAQDAPPMDQGGAPPPDQGAPPDPGVPPPDQGADQDDPDNSGASFQTFYDQLGSQGSWVQTDNYGYVWQPNLQDPDWRPYSNGHWVYTDDGWTWVADASEPWGWATYHYGRWVNLDGEGWVWVPGYTWAPAWVSWRYGGGYCGWAPLPPETTVGIDFGGVGLGFHIGGDCDTAYDIGPGYYNFVPVGYIGARNYRPYYINRYNNYTIINNTRNVTNIVVGGTGGANRFGRVTTGGPNFATVNAQSRTPVQRASLVSSSRVGNASLQGNQLVVYAPRVSVAATARPRTVGAALSTATVNRGADINRPLTVGPRLAPVAPSPQQIQAAQDARAKIPRNAKIATTSTRLAQPLTAPLTSLQPRREVQTALRPAGTAPAITPTHLTSPGGSFQTPAHVNPSTASHQQEVPRTQASTAPTEHHFAAPIEHHPSATSSPPAFHPAVTSSVHQPGAAHAAVAKPAVKAAAKSAVKSTRKPGDEGDGDDKK